HPERDDGHAGGTRLARQPARRMRREPRAMTARRQLAHQRDHLHLAAAPAGLRVDVQDVHHAASVNRISTAVVSHMPITTSASPKLYWVSPARRKVTMPVHAPAAVAHSPGPRVDPIASNPRRRMTAKTRPKAASPIRPASAAICSTLLC